MRKLARRLSALLALALPLAAAAQTATLVGDFNTTFDDAIFGIPSSSPERFAVLADRVVFSAEEPGTGEELWVSDGTSAGTRFLEDICPGPCSSSPEPLGLAGNVSLWIAQSGESAPWKLWRSDGTEAGTYPLTLPFAFHENVPVAFLDGALYFGYCTEAEGCSLWRSDGTQAGTRIMKTLTSSASYSGFVGLVPAGTRLYLLPGGELWLSDGTAAGTRTVGGFKFEIGPSAVTGTSDGKLFYIAYDGEEGHELWVSDGTSPRRLTRFEAPDPFHGMKPIGSRVYLVVNDVVHGHEIWRSDGTEKGTLRVTDFGFYEPFGNGLGMGELQEVGGRVVFRATDGLGPNRIWASTGNPESTAPLGDVTLDCAYLPSPFIQAGGRVFFVARDSSHGCELWSTDGTTAGTRIALDICTQPFGCNGEGPLLLGTVGGSDLFLAHDGSAHGSEIWMSGGTAAGTRRITDMPGQARPSAWFAWNGDRLFFAGSDGHGEELWIVEDGVTRLVADIARREPSSRPRDLAPFGDRLFFTVCDGRNRQVGISSGTAESTALLPVLGDADCAYSYSDEATLDPVQASGRIFYTWKGQAWSTDGTAAGTVQLTHFAPDEYLYFRAAVLQGKVFFPVTVEGTTEIWRSDGTPQGTARAFDLPGVPEIYGIAALGSELYFAGYENDGHDVWRSDGTPAGTRKVTTGIEPHGEPWFTRVGSSVFFVAKRDYSDTELWKTDGTAAGTVRVRDMVGYAEQAPRELIEHQGKLYFFGLTEGGPGWSLWQSDGTEVGTVPLRSFEVRLDNPLMPPVFHLVSFAGRLYFSADGVDGRGHELWTSDGTAEGTAVLLDLYPGAASSRPSSLAVAGSRLYFAADDGERGHELWSTDGTAAGTRLEHDLAPEDLSSYPDTLIATPTHLYFAADDGLTGRELWSLPLAGGGCQPSPRNLCLGNGRYRVEAAWKDFQGHTGLGTAVALTGDTGWFWFFSPTNVEVMLKVLDGTGLNGHRWVFYGALSSVEYTLTVTDTQTGLTRRYYNPMGQLASVGDTTGFGPLGASSRTPAVADPSPAVLAAESTVAVAGPCLPTAERLCLNGGRFAVEVAWKDFQGHEGTGKAVDLTADTGWFWFFDPANVEVVLKVLDGTPLNGKHWVFYGALSSVEYTITVTDTQTGVQKVYRNPSGRLASVADTEAF